MNEFAAGLREEAQELTREAKRLNLEAGRNCLERGRIYRRVKEASLWKVEYESFGEWLEAVGDDGKSWAYSLIDLYSELEATVPAEAIKNLTAVNARDLTKVPEKDRRDPTIIAAAQEMSNKKFRNVLNAAHPGLALEENEFKSFKLEKGARGVVMECVKTVIEESGGEVKTEGAAIEAICAEWMAARAGESESQRRAVGMLGRTIEGIVEALLPSLTFPNTNQWGQVVLGWYRVRQVFGFPTRAAEAVKPARRPKSPPAASGHSAATNRLQ